MISPEKATTIWILSQEGIRVAEIAKKLGIDPKTVKKIIKNQGIHERKGRSDKIELDDELLLKTYKRCSYWGERTHEELVKLGINVSYPTLMRKLRELNPEEPKFSTPHEDRPGEEFQHDLSPFMVTLGEKKIRLQASVLYYRYSKMIYLKFYTSFNRFAMKCFFWEAVQHFGYVPDKCIIDNTSLVVLRGSGRNALFNKEMVDFAKAIGFKKWIAHEINHSNRKAGNERSFWTVETNFFPGREFSSLEDINKQAKEWCVARSLKRNKNKIIPRDRFEYEKDFMNKVSPHFCPPYLQMSRVVDQQGYILHNTNLYWVGIHPGKGVTVLQYPNCLKIYHQRKMIGEYDLPPFGTRQRKFKPEGVNIPYRPKKQTVPPVQEEEELRKMKIVDKYLDFVLKRLGPQQRYQTIRQVYFLYKRLSRSLFEKTLSRALEYRVKKSSSLERIATYIMKRDEMDDVDFDPFIIENEEINEGLYIRDPDFRSYEEMWGGRDE